MHKVYSKGSEWRKWDLHIHTPESILNNGFASNWDEYVKQLFAKALANDIAAIGITDYFTIDGYKKLKTEYLSNDEKLKELQFSDAQIALIKEILILPNIEFRLDKLVQENRVNFHIIFSDEVPIVDIEENFLQRLEIIYEGMPQGAGELRALTKNNLIDLGTRLQAEHAQFRQHPNPLYTGMMNVVVSDEKITKLLTDQPSLFKGKFLTAIPSDEDLSAVQWNGQGHHTRKVLIQKSDCLFASNPKTVQWGLGQFNASTQEYIKEFKSLKPCIWGSDSHTFEELFTKNANRLCWIKSDPTFEGLKQILYEPEERVILSDRKPDEKKVYEVVDKVRFLDPSFTTNYIEFNQNLTAIIGGKSTGKSILLRSTAKTADIAEFEKRNKSAGIEDKRPAQGFEVVWKDGQVSSLGASNNPDKRIIYIPQSYLNRVVDDGEVTSDIDEIILDVLLQKDDFKSWYDSLTGNKKAISDKVEVAIKNLFENININIEKNRIKKELGDKDGITKQIDKLDRDIKSFQEKSKVSESDLERFNRVTNSIKGKQARIDSISKDIFKLKQLQDLTVSANDNIIQNLGNDDLREEILTLANTKIASYKLDWKNTLDEKIKVLNSVIQKLKEEITAEEKGIADLKEALKEQNALNDLLKEKAKEEKILLNIEELEKEITNSYKQIEKNMKLLADYNADYYSLYLEAKNAVNLSDFDDDLSFDIVTKFKKEHFQESYVNKNFDGRTTRSKDYAYLTEYTFKGSEEHKKFLIAEGWKIIKNEIPKREGVNNREAITSLFKNWFMHDFKVTYQNDDISEMSPGKKSFVLLRLLIDLDDSQCPILIDQPEDDLDNRSIYNQVVKFLRKRKKNRQIIIVTHNPNLVLGADAELSIIANQNGEDTKNKAFTFEYVSGSIENTVPEDDSIEEVLYKRGIQEHICDVLEGGPEAFDKRKKKYNF
ncbi:TrlF family AAA-like ATPase [Croceivirga radicis]|uniref:TrlF family AAA-like ATPase n=1 Tax=Croceivirga radicis TaxID=1929488 RepID=UPI000255BA1D|nr:DNA repair ATPase [Croceivirga radicis]